MSVTFNKPVFNIHVFPDFSFCVLSAHNNLPRIFALFNRQIQSHASRTGSDIIANIGCFLSLSDLNAARNCCKFLHNLFSNHVIWKAWVERLQIIGPTQKTPKKASASLKDKAHKRAKIVSTTDNPLSINHYSQVRVHFINKIVDCLNVTLSPTPAFTSGESYVQLLQLVAMKRDQLATHLHRFLNKDSLAVLKIILLSPLITEEIRGQAAIVASKSGNLAVVEALLFNSTISQKDRGNAIIQASNGHYPIVLALLSNGSISQQIRGIAVVIAASHGHLPIVEALLNNGDILDIDRGQALCSSFWYLEIFQLLLSKGTILERDRVDVVFKATSGGYLNVVEKILSLGTISDEARGLSVQAGSEKGHLSIVQVLLNNGPISMEHRTQSIIAATQNGHEEIVEFLSE